MDKKQLVVLAAVILAIAITSIFFRVVYYTPAKCELVVEPGSNATQLDASTFGFNITYSILNGSIHLVTLYVKGYCWWSITPVLDLSNLRYEDLKLVFVVNNQTVEVDLPQRASMIKAETIEIGPEVTLKVYIRGTILYGEGSIKLIIQELSK